MINTVLDNRFRIEDFIARGVNGGVYRGRDLKTNKLVAVKMMFIPAQASAMFGARLKREAAVLNKLHHPNVVEILQTGLTPDNVLYFAMELVAGRTLKQIVQASGPIEPVKVAEYLYQTALALDAAHEIGIIHRDINPSNIMVYPTDRGERVKLLDFGLAKVMEPESEEFNQLTGHLRIGTSAFCSPECIEGKSVGPLWDVWSLGVTLYFVLTGKLPFDGHNESAVLTAVLSAQLALFSEKNPGNQVPMEVESIVRRTLSRKPFNRPQSAGELAEMFWEAVAKNHVGSMPRKPAAISRTMSSGRSGHRETRKKGSRQMLLTVALAVFGIAVLTWVIFAVF